MNRAFLVYFCCFSFGVYALPEDAKQPIQVEAYTVVIDEHKGLSTYTGGAKVSQGSLMLNADRIELYSNQKEVVKVLAKGSKEKLAYYKQNQPNRPRFIEARAIKINYLIKKEFVQLRGKARLIQGFDTFSGGTLDYDIKHDKVILEKSKDGKDRVKFKIKL